MDLSVIIPVHNLEDWLQPLLDSLAMQKFSIEMELIFVCDYCTDNTKAILEDWVANQSTYLNVIILEAQVGSCGEARNVGLEWAKGKYIQFVDGDDWFTVDYVFQKLFEKAEEFKRPLVRFYYTSNTFPAVWDVMVWQYLFRRDLIGDIRFTSIQPGEDDEFMAKIRALPNFSEITIPYVFYYYNYCRLGSNTEQFGSKGKIEL